MHQPLNEKACRPVQRINNGKNLISSNDGQLRPCHEYQKYDNAYHLQYNDRNLRKRYEEYYHDPDNRDQQHSQISMKTIGTMISTKRTESQLRVSAAIKLKKQFA